MRPSRLSLGAAAIVLAAPLAGQAPPSGSIFNPNIAVIGNVLATVGHNEVEPSPSISLRESEFSFQAVVDPYARADFFVSFSEDEVAIEEGFITFLNLPGELLLKAGKLKGAFGKVNTEHLHARLFVDTPLVMTHLLGSEDGLEDAGISVSRLIPVPGDVFLEATAQVFRGTVNNLFEAHEKNDVAPLVHLRAYRDLTENANLEIGGSWTQGHNLEGPGYRTRIFGADATYRWKPLARSIYHSALVRAEWMLSERETPTGTVRADGFYLLGQYQFARRWFAAARYDESDHPDDGSLRDKGGSLILTFWPSEFSQIRAQGRRTRYELGGRDVTASELLVQLQFSIGAHGAHTF